MVEQYTPLQVADHYCLLPDIRFGVRVDKCRWDAAAGTWTVKSVAGESFVGNFLISGIGALHVPKIPDFPDLKVALYWSRVFPVTKWP